MAKGLNVLLPSYTHVCLGIDGKPNGLTEQRTKSGAHEAQFGTMARLFWGAGLRLEKTDDPNLAYLVGPASKSVPARFVVDREPTDAEKAFAAANVYVKPGTTAEVAKTLTDNLAKNQAASNALLEHDGVTSENGFSAGTMAESKSETRSEKARAEKAIGYFPVAKPRWTLVEGLSDVAKKTVVRVEVDNATGEQKVKGVVVNDFLPRGGAAPTPSPTAQTVATPAVPAGLSAEDIFDLQDEGVARPFIRAGMKRGLGKDDILALWAAMNNEG